jgi:hypothetical protein
MVYVVAEELFPKSHRQGNVNLSMVSLIIGFAVMMVLDVALGFRKLDYGELDHARESFFSLRYVKSSSPLSVSGKNHRFAGMNRSRVQVDKIVYRITAAKHHGLHRRGIASSKDRT